MANSLPDCSTFTAACTSCLFGGIYNTVDPPFVVTSTATYVPTIVVDVTTFANGSSTTNTISSATDTPEEDVLTWESDGITFTYGTTYLNYTSFQFATPSPASSLPDSASACYTGNPNDVTTTEPLLLPAETAASSLIVTLTSDEPLPSLTVPAQILSYLDSLPTVSEQLNGIPLTICFPTMASQPSCVSRTPDGCPPPTSTATVTAPGATVTSFTTVTSPRAADDSNTANDNSMRKRQEGSDTTTTTSSTIDSNTSETSSSSDSSSGSSSPSTSATASNTSFPPGCPTAITETLSAPGMTIIITVTATQKTSTNKLNIGPASISIRSATSLLPAQSPSTTPATSLPAPQSVETSSPNPQPAPPGSPTQAQPTAPAAATTQEPISQPDTPNQPAGSSLNSPEANTAAAPPASDAPASPRVASLSSAVQSAANAATSDADLIPENLIPYNSTTAAGAAQSSTRTVDAASTGAFSGGESSASEIVVYTTTEPYATGFTTRVVTETRTGNVESESTGVGDYIESGLGNSGGSGTESARPVAYTGQANRVGVVDVRGLLAWGWGG